MNARVCYDETFVSNFMIDELLNITIDSQSPIFHVLSDSK